MRILYDTLFKTIACSGLYPQLALADDCNSYRRDSDQVFHTRVIIIVLHVLSVLQGRAPLSRDVKFGIGCII
jgi:hypothetical protein